MISMNNELATKLYNSIFEIPIDEEKTSSQKNLDKIITKDDYENSLHEETDMNSSKESITSNDFYNIDLFPNDVENLILYKKSNDIISNLNNIEKNKEIKKTIIYSNDIHTKSYQYANSSKVYMTEFFKPGWKNKAKKSVIKFKKLMSKIVNEVDIEINNGNY